MKQAALKRQFLREFGKTKKFSVFQKNRITFDILSIRLDYEASSQFTDYIENHQIEVEEYVNALDNESKMEMSKILDNFRYMSTHSLEESIKKFLFQRAYILEHLDNMERIKQNYPLPTDMYEESIFKYKHGLVYVPDKAINSIQQTDFLDCGAYSGESALIFEKEYNPHEIYSFEPVPENYNLLLDNIKLNKLKKVQPIDKGIGEQSKTLKYHSLDVSSYVSEDGNAEMEVVSVDEFVEKHELDIGLIKMDIEGYELSAIKGARETIKKFKPILLISIYHHPEELFNTKQRIEEILPDYKFRIKLLSDVRPLAEIHLIAW